MIRTANDIKQLGTIMGIWAHPDDETWSSAGIMATARAAGQHVAVLSATNGDAGQTADEAQWATSSLRDIRQTELREALATVDVSDVTFLDYDDGDLGNVDETEILHIIERHVRAVQPDTILTFEPNGITGHIDHQQISAWAQMVANRINPSIAIYGAVTTRETYDIIGKRLMKPSTSSSPLISYGYSTKQTWQSASACQKTLRQKSAPPLLPTPAKYMD